MQGKCYCGELHFEVTQDPTLKIQCHCRECQYFTGGAPNFAMGVPAASYTYTKGTPKTFARTDLENPRTREFCANCGTHMTTLVPERQMVIVKVGTLDDPAKDYGDSSFAMFMKDSQPFHVVADGKPCFDVRPPPPAK
jgi:hypothetical protein